MLSGHAELRLCVRVGYEDTYRLFDLRDSSFLLDSLERMSCKMINSNGECQLQPGALGERGWVRKSRKKSDVPGQNK